MPSIIFDSLLTGLASTFAPILMIKSEIIEKKMTSLVISFLKELIDS